MCVNVNSLASFNHRFRLHGIINYIFTYVDGGGGD